MEKWFLTTESWVPLRSQPSERAEMVSQLLFGEAALFLDLDGDWYRLQGMHDGYEGWVSRASVTEIDSPPTGLVRTWNCTVYTPDGGVQTLPAGALLEPGGQIHVSGKAWESPDPVLFIPEPPAVLALRYLHVPYHWGGRTNWGIDCSGLTQMVYAFSGISLLRDAYQQMEAGREVAFDEKRTNDLAFFSKTPGGKVTHVGIVGPGNTLIHASTRVRIDELTPEGIRIPETGIFSHYLLTIRQIL